MLDKYLNVMCGYRKFRQRGSNSDKFFLVDEGRKDPTTNKIWPSSVHIFAGGPMMSQH